MLNSFASSRPETVGFEQFQKLPLVRTVHINLNILSRSDPSLGEALKGCPMSLNVSRILSGLPPRTVEQLARLNGMPSAIASLMLESMRAGSKEALLVYDIAEQVELAEGEVSLVFTKVAPKVMAAAAELERKRGIGYYDEAERAVIDIGIREFLDGLSDDKGPEIHDDGINLIGSILAETAHGLTELDPVCKRVRFRRVLEHAFKEDRTPSWADLIRSADSHDWPSWTAEALPNLVASTGVETDNTEEIVVYRPLLDLVCGTSEECQVHDSLLHGRYSVASVPPAWAESMSSVSDGLTEDFKTSPLEKKTDKLLLGMLHHRMEEMFRSTSAALSEPSKRSAEDALLKVRKASLKSPSQCPASTEPNLLLSVS